MPKKLLRSMKTSTENWPKYLKLIKWIYQCRRESFTNNLKRFSWKKSNMSRKLLEKWASIFQECLKLVKFLKLMMLLQAIVIKMQPELMQISIITAMLLPINMFKRRIVIFSSKIMFLVILSCLKYPANWSKEHFPTSLQTTTKMPRNKIKTTVFHSKVI